jgi:hypothetical protein
MVQVGLIQADMTPEARRAAYLSDITYVTNSELGFDYLRDNLAGVRMWQLSAAAAAAGVEQQHLLTGTAAATAAAAGVWGPALVDESGSNSRGWGYGCCGLGGGFPVHQL